MWALRTASLRGFRNRGLISGTTQILGMKPEIASCYMDGYNAGVIKALGKRLDEVWYSTRSSESSKSYAEICSFHSGADTERDKEQDDDSVDDFVELEKDRPSGDEIDVGSSFEHSAENVNDDMSTRSDQLGMETGDTEKNFSETNAHSAFTKLIISTQPSLLGETLDKWVKEGNQVTQEEVSSTLRHLIFRKLFINALQLSEWLESRQHLEPTEKHYGTHIDLIAKVHGIDAAEKYLKSLPDSFRGEIVYSSLLNNWVYFTNVKKSEELFRKMKKLSLNSIYACNHMLILYKNTDRSKMAGILEMMEEENIKPSVFTYQILIECAANDTTGIEDLIARMKSKGLEPNSETWTFLARHYISIGLKDKAEAVLKEMGADDLIKNRWLCQTLLPLYAAMGREDEVERIWKVCEPNPRWNEHVAAIEAWGLLHRIGKAEKAFETLPKKLKRPPGDSYGALLNVYVNHKMVEKGKELVKRMIERKAIGGCLTWNAMVKLFIKAGEVKKADLVLEMSAKERKGKPFLSSYLTVLDAYAKKGHVQNAERILSRIRQDGYGLNRAYRLVIFAYLKAKVPIYGFSDRLKGDNIVPSQGLKKLLNRSDPFKKLPYEELLR